MQSRLVLVRDKRTYSACLRISTTDLSQEEPMALKEELAAQKARALRFLIERRSNHVQKHHPASPSAPCDA